MLTKYKFFIYCRRSTDETKERQLLTIESQKKTLLELARRESLDIVDVLEEKRTAFKPGRPVFNNLMNRIGEGEGNGLLVWKLDRLTRNGLDAGKITWLIDEGKLLQVRTYEGTYQNTSDSKFIMDIQFALSKKYSNDISDNVKRDLKTKVESKREWPNLSPPGYLNIKEGKISGKGYTSEKQQLLEARAEKLKKPLKRIEIDPIVGPLIQRLFKKEMTGLYTLDQLRESTIRWGLRGRMGKKYSRSAVDMILRKPFYYGLMVLKQGEFEGIHEPLIDKQTFDKVQDILKQRAKPIKHNWNHLFTGLIKCPCGCFITAETKVKKNKTNNKIHRFTYYHCTKRKGTCKQPAINEKNLLKQLERKVKAATIDNMIKELLMLAIKEGHEEEKRTHIGGIKRWQIIYKKCEERLERLLDALTDGLVDKEEYVQKRKEILKEKIEAQEKLHNHEKSGKSWRNYTENLIITSNTAYQVFKEGDREHKIALLKAIGEDFLLKDGVIYLKYKEPFNWVIELKKSKKGSNLSNVLRGLDSNQD
ncbi:recombinase family protein [Patescibacteria group bacterium]